MPNLAILWDTAESAGGPALAGPGLATGGALQAAVLVSLFSDRRAGPDDALPPGDDPRGWWGDTYSSKPIGSRLWLLQRAKRTTETLRLAETYLREAVQWLLDDGVAARIDVLTEWSRRTLLGGQITIYQRDGTTLALRFTWAWEQ